MEQKHTLEELRGHLSEVVEEVKALDTEFSGLEFSPEAREKFDALKEEKGRTEASIKEREERMAYIEGLSKIEESTESEEKFSFQVRKTSVVPDDPTQIEE